jgi:hypothetical protein
MFHLFEYLKNQIHANIIHINHSTKFMQLLSKLMKKKIRKFFVQTYET